MKTNVKIFNAQRVVRIDKLDEDGKYVSHEDYTFEEYLSLCSMAKYVQEPPSSGVSEETKAVLKGAMTEAGANRTLRPTTDYSRGRNDGITEAIEWMQRYQRGEGLFQIPVKKGGS